MRKLIFALITFSSAVFSAPLDVTILKPIESDGKYFDPYVWWRDAKCSSDGEVLKIHLGKRFMDPHFAGALDIQVKMSGLPAWDALVRRGALGATKKTWGGNKLEGSLEFMNRKGVTYATDLELGGCELKMLKQTENEKKQLALSVTCQGLPVTQFAPGARVSAGRISFEIPSDYPIVCNDTALP